VCNDWRHSPCFKLWYVVTSVKGGCIIIQKYFPYNQFQRKLEVHLVCYMGCLQQPLFYKGTWKKDIAVREVYTFCNNNVYVEFSNTFSLLLGHLCLNVVLFASFPYTCGFPGQLMEHYLIVCAVLPFHALIDCVYLTWFLTC
jgi:hypothetical protein